MKTAAIFLIDGFEETEALTTVDILRRGGVVVKIVSLMGRLEVTSKNKIHVQAEELFENAKNEKFDMIIIPGGTIEIANHLGLRELIQKYNAEKKLIGAICAYFGPAVHFIRFPDGEYIYLTPAFSFIAGTVWFTFFPFVFRYLDEIPGFLH